jgi:hypothetical protein
MLMLPCFREAVIKESYMPLIEVHVIENVFNAEQKSQMIRKLTDAMVSIEGENMRGVTWVKNSRRERWLDELRPASPAGWPRRRCGRSLPHLDTSFSHVRHSSPLGVHTGAC